MKSPTDENQEVLFSGMQATGRIHIGNYFGALEQFVHLQNHYNSYIFIANIHSLTGVPKKEKLLDDTNNLILDYLGAGLDPEKVTLFRQSDVPAHANLAWVLSNLITPAYLERAHAYKDAEAKKREVSVGTFMYPVLMAADILLYNTDVVPVGKDQKQHIEYARDIAEKFNFHYGETFKLPEELILNDAGIIPGTDGQKMSKSYNNTIPLFASDEEIQKAVMSIPTDSRRPEEEKNPDELILYQIHKFFYKHLNFESKQLHGMYSKGLRYGDAKKLLIADIIAFVTPMRERRAKYEQDPEMVEKILLAGAMRANEVAMKKLADVYEAVGLTK